ncbi:hypothetical protein HAT93_04514 [Dickeya solani]|nr:hypothetical protein [Dickeya solani]QKO14131.1 hypothetical protein HAT91_02504 [Dickeya solani]QKO18462.1 hypothetical protein HAT92_02389 [Dickeya solani]
MTIRNSNESVRSLHCVSHESLLTHPSEDIHGSLSSLIHTIAPSTLISYLKAKPAPAKTRWRAVFISFPVAPARWWR